MKRELLTTADGSTTIHLPEWNEQYHSKHGAINEAKHVFIEMGLRHFISKQTKDKLSVLEMGFGTGLNAFLTYLFSKEVLITISYTGVEAYPVLLDEVERMNYPQLLGASLEDFLILHQAPWSEKTTVFNNFSLTKLQMFFAQIEEKETYDVIFFDAFGARVQPELWTKSIFMKMFNALLPEGVLVTYSAKGSVRRAMMQVGFLVERLPGPPGKREMLRGTKHSCPHKCRKQ